MHFGDVGRHYTVVVARTVDKLLVSRGVVLYSRTGEAVEAVLRGHTVRAVATLFVAPSSI